MSYYYKRNLLLYSSIDASIEASKLIKTETSIYNSISRTKERDSGLAIILEEYIKMLIKEYL